MQHKKQTTEASPHRISLKKVSLILGARQGTMQDKFKFQRKFHFRILLLFKKTKKEKKDALSH